MVLKTESDRPVLPVQPGTRHQSGPIMIKNRKITKNRNKLKTEWLNCKTGTGMVESVIGHSVFTPLTRA